MKLIIKDRGTGKTTQLIYTSATTGWPIVVYSEAMVKQIKSQAKELNCNIPEPMTVHDLLDRKHVYENIIIDEVCISGIIQNALNKYFGCNVMACTCSPDYTYEESMKMYSNDFDNWPKRNITVSCG